MYTFDMIREAVVLMQADQGPLIQKMREVLIRYEGDFVIPLPDLANEPSMPQLTPALVGEAIDQIALRAASTWPKISSPPLNPTKDRGVRSREYATTREQIITATMEKSRWQLGRRRFYRHLTAYHTSSLVVVPDMETKMPRIEVRDPLSTLVEPKAAESLRDPNYAAFITRFSGAHMRKHYPLVRSEVGGPITGRDLNKMWEVVEWYDCDDVVWGLLGPVESYGAHVATQNGGAGGQLWRELLRLPNRCEHPPVCVPHNVSLAGISSRIASLLGNIDLQARLMALHITAQEKAIFPDTYVIGGDNEPSLVAGEWRDGRTGEVNLIRNAQSVGVLRTAPDPSTGQMIDRLERNFRTSTSLVPQLGGETYGAMRTGRAIDALSGMALDPRVQEIHEISEAYLPSLNTAILSTYKGMWPNKKYSMYCGRANDRRLVEFTPSEHIETLETSVSYFVAGADVMQLTQVLGSLMGAGAIARRTFQEQHPMIGNADAEQNQIREEQLEDAAMQSLQQGMLSGQIPMTVGGMVRKHVLAGKTVFQAIDLANEELQKLQAQQAPPPPEGMVASPEAMPGLSGGPAADQMQPSAEMEPQVEVPGDVSRMRQLLQTMGA